jgi:aspartate 1-decarboxylase
MQITVLKSKISYATISATDLYYVGSITIPEDIMEQANLRENEQVQVVNLNNGERLITYVIKGIRGSNTFALNGPAARLGAIGDKIFILSYADIKDTEHLDPVLIDLSDK